MFKEFLKRKEPIVVLSLPVHGSHANTADKSCGCDMKEERDRRSNVDLHDWKSEHTNDDDTHHELTLNHHARHSDRNELFSYSLNSNELNYSLIHNKENPDDPADFYEHDDTIDALDRTISNNSTHKPMTVYHVAGFDPDEYASMHPERKIHLPAYTSTTIDRDYVANVLKSQHRARNVLAIHLPKGHPGYYIGRDSAHPNEKELLLPRGLNLQVHSTPTVITGTGREQTGRSYVWHAHPVKG